MCIFLRSFLPQHICLGVLCLALAMLTACARPVDTVRIPADPLAAKDTWTRFMTVSERTEASSGPFRLNATLYYSGNEESQRVLVYFWGNGDKKETLPLRMDILMNQGSVMAAIREDSRGLFIYVPHDKTLYHARDNNLLDFDVPVPFSLADLAALATGRSAAIFAPSDNTAESLFDNASQGDDGTIVYTVANAPLAGNVSIDANGLLRAWTDGKGWNLQIEYWPDSTRPTPRKLLIKHAEGRQATLIVRTLDHTEPFTPKQLQLTVPQGTLVTPLERSR